MVMAAVRKSIGYEFLFANINVFQVLNCTSWLWYVPTLFPGVPHSYMTAWGSASYAGTRSRSLAGRVHICSLIGLIERRPLLQVPNRLQKQKALGILTHHG